MARRWAIPCLCLGLAVLPARPAPLMEPQRQQQQDQQQELEKQQQDKTNKS